MRGGLLELKIELINSRPCHPQTNGKLERFFRTFEGDIGLFDGVEDCIRFYDGKRHHWALDMASNETPAQAYRARWASEAIRKKDPNWMEADLDG